MSPSLVWLLATSSFADMRFWISPDGSRQAGIDITGPAWLSSRRQAINMKKYLLLAASSLLIASVGLTSETNQETVKPQGKTMSTPSVSLGYVVLYVKDVSASLTFYEQAFGLSRRFFNDDNGKAYGELETGAARLAFYSFELAKTQLKQGFVAASPDKAPLGVEIAFVTPDVPALFARAVKAGATVVSEPEAKPWGQTVACLRDKDGHLVELCTPLP
jgi:lactoylglutathione lyase